MSSQDRPDNNDTAPSAQVGDLETRPPIYVSFVLRCRCTEDGRIIARLSEVSSGTSCSVAELDDLPDLVRRWMQRTRAGKAP